jgi:hypothetical protein
VQWGITSLLENPVTASILTCGKGLYAQIRTRSSFEWVAHSAANHTTPGSVSKSPTL